MGRDLYNFSESRFLSLSHELRIFIFGAEVSSWLKGEVAVTYGNRDSFNTCSFELANPRKVWQLTKENLSDPPIWRKGGGEYSESPKMGIFKIKNDSAINPDFTLRVKEVALGGILTSEGATTLSHGEVKGSETFKPPAPHTERAYRLAVNDCIFSKNDPMRIFMRNPYNTKDQWVEIFCGFVQEHPVTTNYATGESSVRINGYCIKQMLQRMRVRTNPFEAHIDKQPLFDRGFYADFTNPSKATHPFAQTSLENTIKELILGSSTLKAGQQSEPDTGGLGDFKMGNTICYNPSDPQDLLERWHLMTLFGVNKVPFPTSVHDDLWLTYGEMTKIGEGTVSLLDTYAQGPEGRYLHLLLPYEGTGAGALVQATVAEGTPTRTEWTTKWEIIRDFAQKLDFQVLTSPSGDILVEFPMYGFTPHMFSSQPPDLIDTGKFPEGMAKLFTFDKHQLEDTLNDETGEDVCTILMVDGGNAFTQSNIDGDSGLEHPRAFVYSPVLVARYGVVSEEFAIPYAGQRSAEIGDKQNTIGKRISRLALIEYMKRLADMSSWDGSVVFRPFLFPNRPIWLKRSGRMGLTTSVSHRWSIGRSAGTNISLHMLMSERYDPTTKLSSYRLPTGATNTPISYASIWGEAANSEAADGDKETGDANSGVIVEVGTVTSKNTTSNGSEGSVGSDAPPPSAGGKKVTSEWMYPPFSEVLERALKEAASLGLHVTVTSAYRSPAKQLYLKNHPEERAKKANGQPVGCGEPWKSLHQYGLAVDIKIGGNMINDYRTFAKLCQPEVRWGNVYDGDYVHYEWNSPTARQANDRRLQAKIDDGSGRKHLDLIWGLLDNEKGIFAANAAVPATSAESLAASQGKDVKTLRKELTGAGDPAKVAACKDDILNTAGIAKLK